MDKKQEILLATKQIKGFLKENRLKEAFTRLSELNSQSESWEISNRLRQAEETYRYMIHYMFEGVADPQREQLHSNLVSEIKILTDKVERNLLVHFGCRSFYIDSLKWHDVSSNNLKRLINDYLNENEKAELSIEAGIGVEPDNNGIYEPNKIMMQKEECLHRIFNYIWLTQHLSDTDVEIIHSFILNNISTDELNRQVISALMLGLNHYYDSKKINLLLEIYLNCNDRADAMRALVCAILSIQIHHESVSSDKQIITHIEALADNESFIPDVKSIIFDLIRTRDTDRISKKMKEEVIPELMKLQPEILRRFKDSDVDMVNMEENPEWAELLDKTGLSDKLKEMSELQMDGGDVFMIAFSNLKNFSFFQRVPNWFLPFSISHSELTSLQNIDNDNLMELISNESTMCDSDKFSFGLSIAKMPVTQRSLMLNQLDAQFEQIAQHRKNSLNLSLIPDYRAEASRYIRDIYRFFNLFHMRHDFNSPFRKPVNLSNLPVIGKLLASDENLQLIGEFYFKRGYYNDARILFDMMPTKESGEGLILQKIGFCFQSEEDYQNALNYYLKAEIVNPDNLWLIKKIALCHKNLSQFEMAAHYYRKAIDRDETNLGLVMNLGHCLLQSGNTDEALKCYYKVEYLDEKGTRAIRPIAWCEYEKGNYLQSRKYYDKILSDNPSAQDYLNAGHLMFALNDWKCGIELYRKSVENSSIDTFIKSFNNDRAQLIRAGLEESQLPIIIDKLLYDMDYIKS